MMRLETYFEHDSDDQILQKRSHDELKLWLQQINYNVEESDRLAKISSNVLKDRALRDAFLEMITYMQDVLKELKAYEKSMPNYKECDHLECDMFYINKHQSIGNKYLNTIKGYQKIKDTFYSQFLH